MEQSTLDPTEPEREALRLTEAIENAERKAAEYEVLLKKAEADARREQRRQPGVLAFCWLGAMESYAAEATGLRAKLQALQEHQTPVPEQR